MIKEKKIPIPPSKSQQLHTQSSCGNWAPNCLVTLIACSTFEKLIAKDPDLSVNGFNKFQIYEK